MKNKKNNCLSNHLPCDLAELDLRSIVDRYEHMGFIPPEQETSSTAAEDKPSESLLFAERTSIDNNNDDGWSCLTASSSFQMLDACAEGCTPPSEKASSNKNNISTWEIMSEVGSVVTLDGSTITDMKSAVMLEGLMCVAKDVSYLDVAKQGVTRVESPPTLASMKKATRAASQESISQHSIPEDEPLSGEEPLFDSFFVMEGIKGGRGGRAKTMFKGNPRKRNNWGEKVNYSPSSLPRGPSGETRQGLHRYCRTFRKQLR